jgi:hypothetical protein
VLVPIEGVVCLPVTKAIKCLRGVCNERLKYEVEYSLKKGTSENSYLLQVCVCVRWGADSCTALCAKRVETASQQPRTPLRHGCAHAAAVVLAAPTRDVASQV